MQRAGGGAQGGGGELFCKAFTPRSLVPRPTQTPPTHPPNLCWNPCCSELEAANYFALLSFLPLTHDLPCCSELEAARKEAAAAKESVAHEMAIMRRQLASAQAAQAEAEKVRRWRARVFSERGSGKGPKLEWISCCCSMPVPHTAAIPLVPAIPDCCTRLTLERHRGQVDS